MIRRHVARRHAGLILLVAVLAVTPGGVLRADAAGGHDGAQRPLDLVRVSITRLQAAQRAEIREIAETLFDFEEMSRRMLMRHWNDGDPAQQAEFVRLLESLLRRTYIDVIASAAWVSMSPDGESIDGPYAQVRTRMGGDVGPEVSINYRLSRRGVRWAVYDVLHEDVSLVANYRRQFTAVLRTASFAELLERMRSNEHRARRGVASFQDVGRRILLLSVVTDRWTR